MRKIYFTLLLVAVSFSTFAADTTTILTCDKAKLEMVCWDNGYGVNCRRQLYVFGDAKDHFITKYMINYPINNEVIIYSLRSIQNSEDYVDETNSFRHDGRVHYLKMYGDSIKLESYRTSQPTGGIYLQKELKGEYIFRNCR